MQHFAVTEKIIPVSFLVYVYTQARKAGCAAPVPRVNAATLVLLNGIRPITLLPSPSL